MKDFSPVIKKSKGYVRHPFIQKERYLLDQIVVVVVAKVHQRRKSNLLYRSMSIL